MAVKCVPLHWADWAVCPVDLKSRRHELHSSYIILTADSKVTPVTMTLTLTTGNGGYYPYARRSDALRLSSYNVSLQQAEIRKYQQIWLERVRRKKK